MNCFVGEVTHEQCHKQDYKPMPDEVISLSDLPEEDQNLLNLRVSAEIKNICHYHKFKYLEKFNHIFGKKCCDPLKLHKKTLKNGLRKILVAHLSKPTNFSINLIPGKALCPTCASKIFIKKSVTDPNKHQDEFIPDAYEFVEETTLQQVSSVCETLELSLICKILKLNKEQRHSALQKTTDKIASAVKRKLETSFGEDLEEKDQPSCSSQENEYEMLIKKLKEKCKLASKDDKIKIISLFPNT